MHPKAATILSAVSPDGCIITATVLGAESGTTPLLNLSDGHLHLSCTLDTPLTTALLDTQALAARLMHAAGCPPDSRACANLAKQMTLRSRRRAQISHEEAAFLCREAAGLIEEACDEDDLPDALMERFWGSTWARQIPRLPHSTRQRIELMARTLSNTLKESSE